MAIGDPPAVPPSLAEIYASIISPRFRPVTSRTAFQRTGFFDGARAKDPRPLRLQIAEKDAIWLADQYIPNANNTVRLDFINDRKIEILSGVFNPTYFVGLSLVRDYTQFIEPVVSTYYGPIDPAYDDPLRQPSNASYGPWDREYPTPPLGTGLPDPYPGWFGEVLLNQYGDRWHAARVLSFNPPPSYTGGEYRPIYFGGDVDYDFDASFRGNKMWAGYSFAYIFTDNYTITRYIEQELFRTLIPPAWYYPEPPPDATPYSWSMSRDFSFSLQEIGWSSDIASTFNLNIFCYAFPPLGRYFALNDSVECSSVFNLSAYFGKPL